MHNVYPPLRRKILVQILKIVFLFGLLGFSLLIGIYVASSDPKVAFQQLSKNTVEIQNMAEAWNRFYAPIRFRGQVLGYTENDLSAQVLARRFARAMDWFDKYPLKNDEAVTYKQIQSLWSQAQKREYKIDAVMYLKMRLLLNRFSDEIRYNIERNLEKNATFGKRIVFLECLIFFLGLFISVYFSERFSSNIVQPLKKMTEVLKHKPNLQEKLKFPEPSSLEIKFLMNELTELWKRLGEVQAQNLRDLAKQQKQSEAIFAAMEDAVLVLDDSNNILHYNAGFLHVIQAPVGVPLVQQPWEDLSISSNNYLALRNLVRKEDFSESLFVCTMEQQKRVFRVRKRFVTDGDPSNTTGTVLLLHDITAKLPKEKEEALEVTGV